MIRADFKLNENESIIFSLDIETISSLNPCDELLITYKEDQEIVLYKDTADDGVRVFYNLLSLALSNQLVPPFSIRNQLGLLWNRILVENLSHERYAINDDTDFWIGNKYYLWSPPSGNQPNQGNSWLYNNEKGEIIWEVTPLYPWIFDEPQPGEHYFSYEEFMKNYKPLLTRIIPREVAQEWLTQITPLVQRVDFNRHIMQ